MHIQKMVIDKCFIEGNKMVIDSKITIPDESSMESTIIMTVGEWRQIRDDLKMIANPSVPLATFTLQFDKLVQNYED